jgi:hypothetical protein
MGQGRARRGSGGRGHAPPPHINPSTPVQGAVPAYTPSFGSRGRGRGRGRGHALPPFVGGVVFPPGGGYTAGNPFAPPPAGGQGFISLGLSYAA